MSTPVDTTRDRMLRAFMLLVAERGFEATTTRAVAEAAGVNEVTIFRHFGDKMTLAREAVRQLAPVRQLVEYRPRIDASSPETAAAGLLDCLRYLRDTLWEHRELVQFGMSDAWRYPELLSEIERAPQAASVALAYALEAARPALRPVVDTHASALSLQSLIFTTVLWQSHGWLSMTTHAWDDLLAANIRPLIRD